MPHWRIQTGKIYQKPNDVLDALALKPGEVVADYRGGLGYLPSRFSNALKESGKVYAVDVSQDMIDYMNDDSGDKRQECDATWQLRTILACRRLGGSDLYLRLPG